MKTENIIKITKALSSIYSENMIYKIIKFIDEEKEGVKSYEDWYLEKENIKSYEEQYLEKV